MADAASGEYIATSNLELLADNGKTSFKPGDKIKLTAKQAEILLAKGAVKVK
jgi:hypothetical protein